MKKIVTDVTKIGDPFVLLDGDTYYMYATSAPDGIKVFTATEVGEKWTDSGYCYLRSENSFGYECFWAPEVVKRKDGKFVMHYTARWDKNKSLRIGVATADSPLGPFTDVTPNRPMFDMGWASIDAHCLIDDGQSYLYFVRDVSENIRDGIRYSEIYAAKLSDDLTQIVTEPIKVLSPSQDWEFLADTKWRWNEGPFVHKHDGKYYLMYSANCYNNKLYSVGYATADSPFGPFVKAEENPILFWDDTMSGPGHNALFYDKSGDLTNAFHIHTDPKNPSGDRRACFCKAGFKNGKLFFY